MADTLAAEVRRGTVKRAKYSQWSELNDWSRIKIIADLKPTRAAISARRADEQRQRELKARSTASARPPRPSTSAEAARAAQEAALRGERFRPPRAAPQPPSRPPTRDRRSFSLHQSTPPPPSPTFSESSYESSSPPSSPFPPPSPSAEDINPFDPSHPIHRNASQRRSTTIPRAERPTVFVAVTDSQPRRPRPYKHRRRDSRDERGFYGQ
ncbi:hypothetical protein BCR35DRAFT_41091 [Leucosporidium creatinivorum]|uniref:Uncharacterized protein n=1 Tax=Leucosporidium creatinivorum TaxID=106004 RepID=A0A1Y2C6R2_9BASI|nr:hypothetical protein BCR35DRAFT_41091 [Leucosporidium creatinivorum]